MDKPLIHRPRKRFGQNFLRDPYAIQRILSVIGASPGDQLVEIGPGQGAITLPLLRAVGTMDAIELDHDLIGPLARNCETIGQLRIHNADALDFDFCSLRRDSGKLRLVGNLPYNISTPLLFGLLKQARCIHDMHFMLQKEVVDRLAAVPETKSYGRLSVMVQSICSVAKIFTLPPRAFFPVPKVESAFVRLTPLDAPVIGAADRSLFELVVGRAFSQRRKTLRNTLRDLVSAEELSRLGVDPGLRAECLDIAAFARIAHALGHEKPRAHTPMQRP